MTTPSPSPTLDELERTVHQIENLIRWIATAARHRGDEFSRNVSAVVVNGSGLSREQIAKRLLDDAKAVERNRGDLQGRAELCQVALDLHALRATLPDLAARTCIEIGVIARNIDLEARS